MKKRMMLAGLMGLLFTGCSTAPVALAPVGPNPIGLQNGNGEGQLVVYSRLSGHREGADPTWYQHADYTIYQDGKKWKHVDNSTGHYSQDPRIVSLSAGDYVVEARAKGILEVRVPVVVKAGETTSVHLDGQWQPEGATPQTALVSVPAGYPVGWRAGQ